jgi:cell wall assembly regulator SMI1
MSANITSMWARFDGWLADNWPEGLRSLNPPASDEQIAALEQALGVALPEDYTASLKVHNGQSGPGGGMFDGSLYLSADEVLAQWAVWKDLQRDGPFDEFRSDPVNGIKDDWWNPAWIPFTHDGSGNHLCLDLDPAGAGRPGQIITMWHDMAERELLVPDFGSWFKAYTKGVFAGEYVYSDAYSALINRRDAETG